MVEPGMVETMKFLGMTEREAKLYLALLQRQEMNSSELHRVSGIMRTKAYETLQVMVEKGFCMERVENRRRFFRAIPPHLLKETLQRKWEEEAASKRSASEKIFKELEERLKGRPSQDASLDKVQLLRSLAQIQRKFIELLAGTQKEILSFCRSPYACEDPEVLKDQIGRAHV